MNNWRPPGEEITIDDLIAEEFDQDSDQPIPASAEIGTQELTERFKKDVEAASGEAPDLKKLEPHDTYGMADEDLKKPYSSLEKTPKGMYIKSGNEEGESIMETEQAKLAGFTDKGVNKEKNDDGILLSESHNTIAATDGVGGNAHGEVASNVTLHTLATMLDADPEFNLKEAPNLANLAVREFHDHNEEEYKKCSATFAAVQITPEGTARMTHVGDAKIIWIRNGEIMYDSTDDNLLELIKKNQGIDDKAAKDFIFEKYKKDARPDGLVQSIGAKEQVINFKNEQGNVTTSKEFINHHFKEEKVESEDVFFVASDGKSLDSEEIKDAIVKGLKEGKSENIILEELRKEAKKRMEAGVANPDNVSEGLIVIK
jgi:serine/threonine protein phosphatase PrpC